MKVDNFTMADHERNISRVLALEEVADLFNKTCEYDEEDKFFTSPKGFDINETIRFLNFLKSDQVVFVFSWQLSKMLKCYT